MHNSGFEYFNRVCLQHNYEIWHFYDWWLSRFVWKNPSGLANSELPATNESRVDEKASRRFLKEV